MRRSGSTLGESRVVGPVRSHPRQDDAGQERRCRRADVVGPQVPGPAWAVSSNSDDPFLWAVFDWLVERDLNYSEVPGKMRHRDVVGVNRQFGNDVAAGDPH